MNKKQVSDTIIRQIVTLFCENYENYHYKNLCTYGGVLELILNKQFNCVYIMDGNNLCGFAGYYLKQECDNVKEFQLAHLLVDERYRGNGYGSMLEDLRLDVIGQISNNKVIYASCVEKPYNSIRMKADRGFYVGGFRYHYRPRQDLRDNSVVMINTGSLHHEIYIEPLHVATDKLLRLGNPNIKRKQIEPCCGKYSVRIEDENKLGRVLIYISVNSKKEQQLDRLDEFYLKGITKKTDKYIGVRINPSISGFGYIDNLLIKNNFFPICYIPYVENGYGMLEYQFLQNGIETILNENNITEKARKLIEYLYK